MRHRPLKLSARRWKRANRKFYRDDQQGDPRTPLTGKDPSGREGPRFWEVLLVPGGVLLKPKSEEVRFPILKAPSRGAPRKSRSGRVSRNPFGGRVPALSSFFPFSLSVTPELVADAFAGRPGSFPITVGVAVDGE